MRFFTPILLTSVLGIGFAQPVVAGGDYAKTSVRIDFERLDLSGDNSLDSMDLEFKMVMGDTTVVFSPSLGQRNFAGGDDASAMRFGGGLYQNFNDRLSGHSYFSVAENEPVFAKLELGQELSYKVAKATQVTGGLRFARYFGDRDVMFYSLGARHYFKHGSFAYRATLVDPDNHNSFLTHLANLTVNDDGGRGKTQLWLSAGGSSTERQQFDNQFSGQDFGGTLKRVQPLSGNMDVVLSAGLTSYDRPEGRRTGNLLGIGLQFDGN